MNRMTCAKFLATLRQEAVFYEDLARTQAIRPRFENDNLQLDLLHPLLAPATREWLKRGPLSARELLAYWLRAQIVAQGPKIFQPTTEQCLVIEQIAPRIVTSDYAQPYPVMIVELPERYRQLRACSGQSEFHVGMHHLECVLIGFAPPPVAAIGVEILFSSGNVVRLGVMSGDSSIEDRIGRELGENSYADATALTMPERTVLAGAMRLAVNSMLLLVEFGCRRLRAVNESHHRRLEHYRDQARRQKRGVEESERNLRFSSQLYGFAQEVVLHEEAAPADAEAAGGEHDGPRRPHWRRGHWKMHAFGVGRSERKRIFIRPVFVNRHLLRDDQTAFAATYRIQ